METSKESFRRRAADSDKNLELLDKFSHRNVTFSRDRDKSSLSKYGSGRSPRATTVSSGTSAARAGAAPLRGINRMPSTQTQSDHMRFVWQCMRVCMSL